MDKKLSRFRFSHAANLIVPLIGLIAIVLSGDYLLGLRNERSDGADQIGVDVYQVVHDKLKVPDPRVTLVFLGDSVGRQLFRSGDEPDVRCRYLTSNQAISLAGQFFLLQKTLQIFPNLRQVNLVYAPLSFDNDLKQPYTDDYFCAFFHTPRQIEETYDVTRDAAVAEQQLVRELLPNVTALSRQIDYSWSPTHAHDLPVGAPATNSAGLAPIPVSAVSAGFLAKVRALCNDRGIVLHILPAPSRDDTHYDEAGTPFDASIDYLPSAQFIDQVHFRPEFLIPARGRFVARFKQFLQAP
jgi:hypothetical protein